MKNTKQSSKQTTALASSKLNDGNSSQIAKQLAGSVLSQFRTNKQTSKEMETKASDVLKSNKYSSDTKTLAASVLSQSNKAR